MGSDRRTEAWGVRCLSVCLASVMKHCEVTVSTGQRAEQNPSLTAAPTGSTLKTRKFLASTVE